MSFEFLVAIALVGLALFCLSPFLAALIYRSAPHREDLDPEDFYPCSKCGARVRCKSLAQVKGDLVCLKCYGDLKYEEARFDRMMEDMGKTKDDMQGWTEYEPDQEPSHFQCCQCGSVHPYYTRRNVECYSLCQSCFDQAVETSKQAKENWNTYFPNPRDLDGH